MKTIQKRLAAKLAAVSMAAGLSVQAAPILQDVADSGRSFAFNATFAQSFTAQDAKISSIRFSLLDQNTFLGGLQFTVTLFQGQGFSGPVLGSATRSFSSLPPLVDWTPNFVDFDFGAVTLNVGQNYTAQISSASGRGVADFTGPTYGNLYPGGIAYDRTTPLPGEDMTFEVLPVPEPTSAGLWGLGLVLVFGTVTMRAKAQGQEGMVLKLRPGPGLPMGHRE